MLPDKPQLTGDLTGVYIYISNPTIVVSEVIGPSPE